MSCYCKCSLTLPHDAVGWSEVCVVVFPDHKHFLKAFLDMTLINNAKEWYIIVAAQAWLI